MSVHAIVKLAQFLQTWRGTRLENQSQCRTILALIEGGVIMHDARLSRPVDAAIEADMQPANSWYAAVSRTNMFPRQMGI